MQLCAKCGNEQCMANSGYCALCRHLLRLDDTRLGKYKDTPPNAVIMYGEPVPYYKREAARARKLHKQFNRALANKQKQLEERG